MADRLRFRFAEFTLSPARRELLRGGRPVPLIPRYFDLLVLLVERRAEALHRRALLDAVWADVVVSEGALTQAVRTLRRTLEAVEELHRRPARAHHRRGTGILSEPDQGQVHVRLRRHGGHGPDYEVAHPGPYLHTARHSRRRLALSRHGGQRQRPGRSRRHRSSRRARAGSAP